MLFQILLLIMCGSCITVLIYHKSCQPCLLMIHLPSCCQLLQHYQKIITREFSLLSSLSGPIDNNSWTWWLSLLSRPHPGSRCLELMDFVYKVPLIVFLCLDSLDSDVGNGNIAYLTSEALIEFERLSLVCQVLNCYTILAYFLWSNCVLVWRNMPSEKVFCLSCLPWAPLFPPPI